MNEFYTYMYLRESGTPYYVGKGKGERAFHFHKRISKPPKERILIQYYETEQDAFEAEKFLIAAYGRKDLGTGILINRSDGGEGPAGQVRTEEIIEKWKKKYVGKKKRPHTLETRQKLSECFKRLKIQPTDAARALASEANRTRIWTPEMRLKLVAGLKARPPISAETRMKMSEAQRERNIRNPNHLRQIAKLGGDTRWGNRIAT